MKKYILIIAVAIASLFAYSCTSGSIDREEAPVPAVKLVPLVLNSGVSVKTSLNSDGTVSWSDKDQIAVIDCMNEVRPFSSSISEDRTSATFKGKVADNTEQFYAVYPFGSVTAANESSISVTLPASQNPTPGTFENNLNISVASGSKSPGVEEVNGVKFNNLCGLLRFTMPAELGSINKVSFTANRAIAGDLTISKETMNFTGVTGTVSTITKEGNFEKGSTFYFVITPGDIVGFSISVTTSNGVILTKSSENKIQISAGKIKNLGTIPMVVANENLSVAHTTSEGILTGTEFKFTPSLDANTKFNAELINASGAVVRSLTSTATGSEFALPAESGKPYIPQGDYTFRYSYTIGSVNYTKSQEVTVPAPTFAVSVSAETSYSLSRTDASKANADYAGAPMQIRNITATISGISEAVLKQVGATYSASITNAYFIATAENVKSLSHIFGTTTATALGSHTLTATCKFDGVTVTATAEEPCVITGLPYTAAPPKKNVDFPWTGNSFVTFNSGNVRISADAGSIVPTLSSSQFYAEGNLSAYLIVDATLETKGYRWKEAVFWGDYKYSSSVGSMGCYLDDIQIGLMSGPNASEITNYNNWTGYGDATKQYTGSFECALVSGYNTIKFKNHSSITPSIPYVYVNSVELKYR